MSLYWIAYDLDKPGKDYTGLISRLERLGAVRVLLSDWLLRHDATTPKDLRDDLSKSLDKNDRIIVAELTNNTAWRNLLAADDVALDLFDQHAS